MSDYSDSSSSSSSTYAQIVVPSYDLEDTVSTSNKAVTTGSSFIRLGSFPSLINSADQPSGFANSLALAQLVGGAATTYSSSTTDLASTLGETADVVTDALPTDTQYGGDTNYYLGFADDTRYRGSDDNLLPANTYIDWTEVPNTVANRQLETGRLLFKGGWWDHADGNRITTTSGDKIEVIQGNYKMIVLGRQPPTTSPAFNAAITDRSGGHPTEQDGAPEPCMMSIEWSEADQCWNQCYDGGGNITVKTGGKQAEYFQGTYVYEEIGKSPVDSGVNVNIGVDPTTDPVIKSKTWAQSIEEYIGADGKPVNTIFTYTHAKAIDEVTFAATINSVTTAALITETRVAVIVDTVIGALTDILIGPKIECHIGPRFQFHNLKNELAAEKSEAAALKTTLLGLGTAICGTESKIRGINNQLSGTVSELRGTVTAVEGEVTRVGASQLELRETVIQLGADVSMLYDAVMIA